MFRPPTKYSEYLQDVRKSIDYILSRVNSTTVGTLQQVTNAGSTTTNAITTGGITTDYVQLNTLATPTLAPGMFAWNDAFGTADLRLKGGNVTLQLGQETLARVVNKTGADLLESQYRVVRVRIASEGGSQGQRLAVVLAQGNNDPDSVTTLGIVTETILNNQEGFITVFGNVNNIDTTGSLQGETWLDGDVLYLSPTIPGALTKVKPIAPNHSVTMGYVIYAHGVNGKIFVKVDNGYELDELHNVRITAVANNDLLQYNSTQQVWKNVAASVAVPTPTLAQVTTAGNTTTNAITVGGLTVGQVGGSGTISFPTTTSGFAASIFTQYASNSLNLRVSNTYVKVYGSGQIELTGSTTITGITGAAALVVQQGNAAWSPVADFNGSAGTALRVNTNGNILIGTTTDAGYKLDVNGTARIATSLTVSTAGSGSMNTYLGGSVAIGNDFVNNGYILQIKSVNTGIAGIYLRAGGAGGYPILFCQDANGTASTTFIVRETGNVAIGTTTAIAKFTVTGSITAASLLAQGVYFNNTLVAAANNDVLVGLDINPTFTNGAFTGVTNLAARIQGNTEISRSGADTQLTVARGSGASFIIQAKANSTSTSEGVNLYWTANTWLKFVLGSSVVANFSNVGNLLVGTSTDAGYKLDVNGTARVQNTTTITKGGANYITFEPSANGTTPFLDIFFSGQVSTRISLGTTSSTRVFLLRDLGTASGMGIDCGAIFSNSNAILIGGTQQKLQIAGTTDNFIQFTQAGTSNRGTIGYASGQSYMQIRVNASTDLATGTFSTAFFSSGNVGIGTTTDVASSLLTIDSTTKGFLQPRMTNAQALAITTPATGLQVYDTTNNKNLLYNGTLWQNVATESWVSAQGYLTSQPWVVSGSNIYYNTGNVGIGTTTPTDKLHIVDNTNGNKFGRISAGGTDASAAWVAQNDQVDNIVYRVFGSGVAGFQMGIALARSASLIANLDGTGKFLIGTYSNTDIIFGTGDQSRIRVSGSNGNVMIGTLTDIGTKLNVSGEINSAGYRVNNVFGWSGTINIPTTPPISITVDGGIITNVV